MRSLPLLALLGLASPAWAVPAQFVQQGRLAGPDGAGLEGSHDLTFRLYGESAGGAPVWEEAHATTFTAGVYTATLGETVALDSGLLLAYPLWLELEVDGTVLSPRQPVTSAPYAGVAGVAERLEGGAVDATGVSVGGSEVIASDGRWVGPTPDVDWMDLSGVPADLVDGDADTLAGISCSDREALVYDAVAGSWGCGVAGEGVLTESEVRRMVTATALDLAAGSTIGGRTPRFTDEPDADTLGGLSCLDGEIARWDGVALEWTCGADAGLDAAAVGALVDARGYASASDLTTLSADVAAMGTTLDTLATDVASGSADLEALTLTCDTLTGEVADLGGRVTVLESGALSVSASLSSLAARVTSVEGGVSGLTSRVGALETDATTTASTLTTLSTTVSTQETRLAAVETSASGLTTRVGALETAATTTASTLASQGTRLAAVEASASGTASTVASLSTTVSSHTTRLAALETASDGDTLAGLSCSDGELAKWDAIAGAWTCDTDLDTLGDLGCTSGQIAKWNGSAWACAADNNLTEAQVDAYAANNGYAAASDVTALGSRVGTLETDATALGSRVGTLETGATALDGRVDALESGATTTSGTLSSLSSTVASLSSTVTSMLSTMSGLASTVSTVQTTVSSLGATVASLTSTTSSLSSSVSSLTSTVGSLTTSLSGLASTVSTLGSRVSAVEAITGALATVATTGSWDDLLDVPADLADGDDDTLADLGCASGETVQWDGTGWTCVTGASSGAVESAAEGSYTLAAGASTTIGTVTPGAVPIVQVWQRNEAGTYGLVSGGGTCEGCGTGAEGALTWSAGTTAVTLAAREYNLTDLTVPAGMTLTFTGSGPVVIRATGTVNILGTVNVAANGASAGPGGYAGGTSRSARATSIGSYVYYTDTLSTCRSVSYPVPTYYGMIVYYSGSTNVSVNAFNGNNTLAWWSDGSLASFNSVEGGNGGGILWEGYYGSYVVASPGGGGGGAIVIQSRAINVTGNIDAHGADGALVGSRRAMGGAGGSIWLRGTLVNVTGSLNVAGGNGYCVGDNGRIRVDSTAGYTAPPTQAALTTGSSTGLAPSLETSHDPTSGVVTLRNNGSTSVTVKATVAAAP